MLKTFAWKNWETKTEALLGNEGESPKCRSSRSMLNKELEPFQISSISYKESIGILIEEDEAEIEQDKIYYLYPLDGKIYLFKVTFSRNLIWISHVFFLSLVFIFFLSP